MRKEDFPILSTSVHNKPLVYLDNAATTQKPTFVLKVLTDIYSTANANIHRGVHYLSQIATLNHETARKRVADFIGAKSDSEIIFTKGTTNSINILAFSFGEAFIEEGDEIIVSTLEHHSNIVPWQMLCQRKKAILKVIPLTQNLTLDLEAYKALFSSKTKLVSVAYVSNVLGIENPIREIIHMAHEKHIPVNIDAAQAVPHLLVNVQELDCDFMAFSAHKMYGPTGLGVLYGKEEWLTKLPPAEGGGEMIDHVTFEKTTYNQLPYKFEAGTPNYVGSVVFAKALDYIDEIGRQNIMQYEHDLAEYTEQQLLTIPGVKVYAVGERKAGAISFNCYNGDKLIHPYDIGMLLDQQGVAVRTGHHCAEPLITYLGVPGTVRVSFALYTEKTDIDTFVAALKKAIMMLS